MNFKKPFIIAFLSLFYSSLIYTQSVSISGQVLRHNGNPLANVIVASSAGDFMLTDENGFFEFSDLPVDQNYRISGFYEESIFEELSVLDACYNRFIVNEVFSALNSQLIANDYNQDGIYQGLDFIRMVNASLKIDNSLNQLDTTWRFFDGQIDNMSTIPSDIESGIYLEKLSADTSLVMLAIKSGDVAINIDHQPAPTYALKPTFYFSDMSIEKDEEIQLSISVRDLEKIMGFQHGIVWDTSYLEFIAYENKTDIFDLMPNEEHLEKGLFPLIEMNLNFSDEQTIEDGLVLYELRFKVLQDANSISGIFAFDSLFIQREVIYLDSSSVLYIIDAEYTMEDNTTTSVKSEFNHVTSFEVSPNPAIQELKYSIELSNAEIFNVILMDPRGIVLQNERFNSKSIIGELSIENLSPGVYYLKLQTTEGTGVRSFIKL